MLIHPALPDSSDPDTVILNLGCGKHPIDGCVNIDMPTENAAAIKGVDHYIDLDRPDLHLPWDERVDGIFGSHVLEHITNTLPLMDELYRVAKPDARAVFKTPYGSSDDAWENPTHIRPMFVGSWGFFGQPHYWREDYGYHADWQLETLELTIDDHYIGQLGTLWDHLRYGRNVVKEMTAVLRANKPARAADRTLQTGYDVVFQRAEMIDAFAWRTEEIGRLTVEIQT